MKNTFLILVLLVSFCSIFAQNNNTKPRNIILMIGDGMGTAQVFSGIAASKDKLNIEQFPVAGFSKTQSWSNYITDSGAGGTAIAIGKKTYNGAIGVDKDTVACKSILERAEEHGKSTAMVVTSQMTHATPASFIAHQASRKMTEAIALDFLKTDIDVFVGGGKSDFAKRKDNLNLIDSLTARKYKIAYTIDDVKNTKSGKLAGFLADDKLDPVFKGRTDVLAQSTEVAINIIKQNEKGFFMMVEGSQIDWGGHANDENYVVSEVLDFDKAVGKALEFAIKDGNTLVIVTADHETGGMTVSGSDKDKIQVKASFTSKDHTAVMVPVFAYGPGAENFGGIYENTAIFDKMMEAFGFEK